MFKVLHPGTDHVAYLIDRPDKPLDTDDVDAALIPFMRYPDGSEVKTTDTLYCQTCGQRLPGLSYESYLVTRGDDTGLEWLHPRHWLPLDETP